MLDHQKNIPSLRAVVMPERATSQKARESWHVLGIISEFVEAAERLSEVRPAVSIFGSARTRPGAPMYDLTIDIARKLSDSGFAVISGGGPWEKYLTVYKEELKKAGVDLNLKILEWNAFQKAIHDWSFDTVALAWGGVVEGDPKQIWHSSSITKDGSNFAGYSNPEVDKLIDSARIGWQA